MMMQFWSWILGNKIIAGAAVVAVIFVYVLGRSHGASNVREEYAADRAVALEDARAADAAAAEQANADRELIEGLSEERSNAIEEALTSEPDAASVALGCVRLRQQYPAHALPAICTDTGGN